MQSITKKIEASKEELWEACNGIVEEHHIYLLQTIRENNRHIEHLIDELNQQIKKSLYRLMIMHWNAFVRFRD